MSTTPVRPAYVPTGPDLPSPRNWWTPMRIVAALVSVLGVVLGTLLVLAGVGVVAASGALHGDDGLYSTASTTWSTPGYAVRSEDVNLHRMPMMPGGAGPMTGTVRITATGEAGHDVFIGIARTADVDRYLGGVARSTFPAPWETDATPFGFTDGEAPVLRPTATPIWIVSAAGPGTQTLTWTPRTGRWCLVVMNPNGSAPVAADVRFAAELPWLNDTGFVLLVIGLLLLVSASVGVLLTVPRARQPSTNQE